MILLSDTDYVLATGKEDVRKFLSECDLDGYDLEELRNLDQLAKLLGFSVWKEPVWARRIKGDSRSYWKALPLAVSSDEDFEQADDVWEYRKLNVSLETINQ